MLVIKFVIVCVLFYLIVRAVLRILLPSSLQSNNRIKNNATRKHHVNGVDIEKAQAKERNFKGGEYIDYEDVS